MCSTGGSNGPPQGARRVSKCYPLDDYDDLWQQIEKTQGYIAGKAEDAGKARGTPRL
jgi:hypothetical protein